MQSKERKGKWQPFDALEGYSDALRKVEKEKEKCEKPILLNDKLEELNEKLLSSFEAKREIEIEYYNRGYLENLVGVVCKIDYINKEIVINQEDGKKKLKINLIIDIKEIR